MGMDSSLERKSCQNGQSVITSRSKIIEKQRKDKLICKSYHLRDISSDFMELDFTSSPKLSFRSLSSNVDRHTKPVEMKRGSIYQSSDLVRDNMRKTRFLQEKKGTKSSCGSDISVSLSVIDSLVPPGENEVNSVSENRLPLASLNKDSTNVPMGPNTICTTSAEYLDFSFCLPQEQCVSTDSMMTKRLSDAHVEICLESEGDLQSRSSKTLQEPAQRDFVEETRLKCDQTVAPEDDGNCLLEKDAIHSLPKSLPEKLKLPDSPFHSETDQSKLTSNVRFSPFRKMLDPIKKSKYQRSLTVSSTKIESGTISNGSQEIKRPRAVRKSLFHDFSGRAANRELAGDLNKKNPDLVIHTSPVHLHGLLKLEHKHGVPSFEFSIQSPEDIIYARTWRTDKAFDWVYTFHSCNRKKVENNGWGSRDKCKQSSIIGQMQVSCYLCSEIRNGESLDNSTVTEFVLYDVTQARKRFSSQEGPHGCSAEANAFSHCPYVPTDLHPHLESAAIVTQVPFEAREMVKNKIEEEGGRPDNPETNASFSKTDQRSPTKVKVVTPSATHGLPSADESGPSPLLHRWRSGGGCDCGGWDMGCPIVVFDSSCTENVIDYPALETKEHLELFVEGAKEKIPALVITVKDDGQYNVVFHAQLTSLQAFSICVALLHTREVSMAVQQRKNIQRLRSHSLKVLLEEEVTLFIQALSEEEKRKYMKRTEIPPTFALDPPFSPIGRV